MRVRQAVLLACTAAVASACGGGRATGPEPPSGSDANPPGANAAGGRLCPCLATRPTARLHAEGTDDDAILVLDGAALGSAALEDDGLPLAPGPPRLAAAGSGC